MKWQTHKTLLLNSVNVICSLSTSNMISHFLLFSLSLFLFLYYELQKCCPFRTLATLLSLFWRTTFLQFVVYPFLLCVIWTQLSQKIRWVFLRIRKFGVAILNGFVLFGRNILVRHQIFRQARFKQTSPSYSLIHFLTFHILCILLSW